MIEEKVNGLLQQQDKKVKDLCAYIDQSDTALRKIYARDSCEVSTLIRIAQFFSVSPCYFFDDAGGVSVSAGNDSIAVGGNAHNVNSFKAIQEMTSEVSDFEYFEVPYSDFQRLFTPDTKLTYK